MKKGALLCLAGIALGIFCAQSKAAAQSEVALATRTAKLQALSEKLKKRDKIDQQQVQEWARRTGIPLRRELPNGKVLQLQRFVPGARPVFYVTYNVDAADTVSTNEVWPGGSAGLSLDGSGMTVGEWDAGAILADHPDLYGRVTQVDGTTAISDHSTHVAGTLIGAGVALLPEARGMAYAGHLNAYDWNADTTEMAVAAANGLLLSNHSYGIAAGWLHTGGAPPNRWWWFGGSAASEDSNFGYYDPESQLWDEIAANAPYYLIVKAAGNDHWDYGPNPGEAYTIVDQGGTPLTTSTSPRPADCAPAGYDCLPTASVAKNILTVGAVDDVPGGYSTLAGPSQVQMTGFSGWGPTDDGRIKPDVVGNGWLLMSTYGHDPYYAAALGTSMAAPNVTGSLLLLQQHYQDIHGSFMRAATLKALAIHTADEAGAADGPDYEYGWGLLNTRSAARVITEDGGTAHQVIEGTLANGGTNTVPINVSEPDAIVKATLVWMDPPGTPVAPTLDPPDSMLVNDLDLRICEGACEPVLCGDPAPTDHLPWRLNPASPADAATTGVNSRDNVEQAVVYDSAAGSYSLEICHKGNLLNNEAQGYSLIISVAPPAPTSSGLLINEDFSGGLPTGWSVQTSKGASWVIKTPVPAHPRYANLTGSTGNYAMVDNQYQDTLTSLRTPTLDLSSTTAAILRFNSYLSYDTLETINVDVSTNGGASWSTVWTQQGFSNTPQLHTLDLTGTITGQASVMLRFRFQSSILQYDGDFWQLDNVQLEVFGGTPPPTPGVDLPGQADNPDPANGSSGAGINAVLSWAAGPLADSHDIYLGTSSTLAGAGKVSQSGTTFDPGTLSYDTTYYWRVDEVNGDGTTPGIIWSFTTAAEPSVDPPGQASNPAPGNGSTGLGVDTTLSWGADSQATAHDVYFGTSATFTGIDKVTVTSANFNPGTLLHGTTYYWRVDEVNSGGSSTGNTWSFATETAPEPDTMHVGDLDANRNELARNRWEAVVDVLIHDMTEASLAGATVSGIWSNGTNGSSTCNTNGSGQCEVSKPNLKAAVTSVSFTVTSVTHSDGRQYIAGDNHEWEGDSDGTSINVPHQAGVVNTPPTASITSPSNGSSFDSGTSILLSGNVTDMEDGNLSASLIWNSSIDGSIGSGGSLSVNTLNDGNHTISASVTDSEGASDTDSVTITVGSITEVLVQGLILGDDSELGSRRRWNAITTVEVRDQSNAVIADATVTGAWSNGASGSSNCLTGQNGTCQLNKNNLKSGVSAVTLTLDSISGNGITYISPNPAPSIILNQP
jgi:hypothetical protein